MRGEKGSCVRLSPGTSWYVCLAFGGFAAAPYAKSSSDQCLSEIDLFQINVPWIDGGPPCFNVVRDTHPGQNKLKNHGEIGPENDD